MVFGKEVTMSLYVIVKVAVYAKYASDLAKIWNLNPSDVHTEMFEFSYDGAGLPLTTIIKNNPDLIFFIRFSSEIGMESYFEYISKYDSVSGKEKTCRIYEDNSHSSKLLEEYKNTNPNYINTNNTHPDYTYWFTFKRAMNILSNSSEYDIDYQPTVEMTKEELIEEIDVEPCWLESE